MARKRAVLPSGGSAAGAFSLAQSRAAGRTPFLVDLQGARIGGMQCSGSTSSSSCGSGRRRGAQAASPEQTGWPPGSPPSPVPLSDDMRALLELLGTPRCAPLELHNATLDFTGLANPVVVACPLRLVNVRVVVCVERGSPVDAWYAARQRAAEALAAADAFTDGASTLLPPPPPSAAPTDRKPAPPAPPSSPPTSAHTDGLSAALAAAQGLYRPCAFAPFSLLLCCQQLRMEGCWVGAEGGYCPPGIQNAIEVVRDDPEVLELVQVSSCPQRLCAVLAPRAVCARLCVAPA